MIGEEMDSRFFRNQKRYDFSPSGERPMDRYFTTVLENSLEDLISAGIVSDQANLEIYKRFQNFVTKSLDQAALLSQQARQNPEMFEDEPFHDEKTAPETPAPDKSAPKMQRYSR